MPFFPSLPENARNTDAWGFNPQRYKYWPMLAEGIMRGESPLSLEEREMIAAFVSGLNACGYCFGAHKAVAAEHGADPDLLVALVEDVDTAPVPDKFKPILRYIKKLTLEPSKLIQSDADAVFAQGWSERALHDAIAVCCEFSFMNRLMMGHGIEPLPPEVAAKRARERVKYGYLAMAAMERGAENVEGLDAETRDLVKREQDLVNKDDA